MVGDGGRHRPGVEDHLRGMHAHREIVGDGGRWWEMVGGTAPASRITSALDGAEWRPCSTPSLPEILLDRLNCSTTLLAVLWLVVLLLVVLLLVVLLLVVLLLVVLWLLVSSEIRERAAAA